MTCIEADFTPTPPLLAVNVAADVNEKSLVRVAVSEVIVGLVIAVMETAHCWPGYM